MQLELPPDAIYAIIGRDAILRDRPDPRWTVRHVLRALVEPVLGVRVNPEAALTGCFRVQGSGFRV